MPKPRTGGRPSAVDRREVVNAIACNLRTPLAWRQLPHDFPVRTAVCDLFHVFTARPPEDVTPGRRWRIDGTWKNMHDNLRKEARRRDGREPAPGAAVVDSQSAKTTEIGGHMVTTPPRR